MSSCDIIIPTYNNADVLARTLNALITQTVPAKWSPRLIITDDGSTDQTKVVVRRIKPPAVWRPTRFVTGSHIGAAGARNRALAIAAADLIMFLGSDIILRPGALAAHFRFHTANPATRDAALGMIRWDPRLKPSPFMEWMTHGGPQNDFDSILGQQQADPCHYFYGSHLSLKQAALRQARYPTVYGSYGWEDIDLGRSLAPRLTLHVLHGAMGLHRHYYTPADIYRRQYWVGQNLVIYQRRYPAVTLVPRRSARHKVKHKLITLTGAALMNWLLAHTARSWSTPRIFSRVTAIQLWRGVYKNAKLSTLN